VNPTRRHLLAAGSVLAAASHGLAQTKPTPKRLLLVNAEYPPFVMPLGDPQGAGMDIEIAREAMRRSGYAIDVQLVPWRRALHMLEFGEADLTTTISRSSDRNRFLRFSIGYRDAVYYRFYGRKGGKLPFERLERLEQLDGLAIGLTSGFFYPKAIREAHGVRVHEGKDLATTVQMLAAARTDLIVVNHLAGAWTIRRLGLEAQLQRQPFVFSSGSPTYMAFSRKLHPDDAALDAMDKGLKQMLADGSLKRIESRYLGE
jgi:polar amino acid transport system substrate-binding protein